MRRFNLPDDFSLSLSAVSYLTEIPITILQEVYNRGVGAWKNNLASVRLKKDFSKNPDINKYPRTARLNKEQWAMARVYAFVMKGKDYYTADNDLARKTNF